jgi:hypothetical protein
MTAQPDGKSLALGLSGGTFVTTGLFTVATYRLVEWRIRKLRETGETVPAYLKHMEQALQAEAACVLLPPPAVSAPGQQDAPPPTRMRAVPEEMISTLEAARRLGCNVRTVRRKAHELGGRQVAGRWVFDQSTILAATAERRTTAA